MRKKYNCLIFLCLFFLPAIAQEDIKNNSEAASFLTITPDARSAGMGDAGTALSADAFSFFHNAATSLFSKEKAELSYSYTPWMRNLTSGNALHSVGGYYKIGDKQSVIAGFRSFNHSGIDITDEHGNITNSFKPSEWALDLGYSRLILNNLSISLTLRYINSDMGSYAGASAGSAVAFDLGAYYRHKMKCMEEKASWAVGLQIANIGSKIKYLHTKYDLPGKIALGGSVHLPFSEKHELQGALDFGYQIIPSGSTTFYSALGAEYIFMKHGVLRGGYHFGDKNKGNSGYGTVGCGVRYYHIRGDFSYLLANSDSALKNTYRITIGIDLGLFKSGK